MPPVETPIDWAVKNLAISRPFFDSIFNGDDWTFVIKIHGLIEASLNHILVSHFKNPNLSSIVARMDTSDRQRGKLAFVKACDLLPEVTRDFINEMSKLRNKLVHDLRNFGLTISDYAANLSKQERNNWRAAIAGQFYIHEGHPEIKTAADMVDRMPKEAIFMSVIYLLQAAQKYRDEWISNAPQRDESSPME